jgi:hypothetical protein
VTAIAQLFVAALSYRNAKITHPTSALDTGTSWLRKPTKVAVHRVANK